MKIENAIFKNYREIETLLYSISYSADMSHFSFLNINERDSQLYSGMSILCENEKDLISAIGENQSYICIKPIHNGIRICLQKEDGHLILEKTKTNKNITISFHEADNRQFSPKAIQDSFNELNKVLKRA